MLRGKREPCSLVKNSSKNFNIILNEDAFNICFKIRNYDSLIHTLNITGITDCYLSWTENDL